MVFIGYEDGSKAYRCYDPVEKRVCISRDVVFDEKAKWSWDEEPAESTVSVSSFTVDFLTMLEPHGSAPATPAMPVSEPVTPTADASPGTGPSSTAPTTTTPATPPQPLQVEFASPPTSFASTLDAADSEGLPHRFRTFQNVLDAGRAQDTEQEEDAEELHLAASDGPKSFRDADEHACWRKAMRDEMDSIVENGTWELATLPAGHRPIGLKWILKEKRDESRAVLKYKARLVAKGFV
jgi:hypothetical protein